ncbi:MAG: hypothetical protein FWF35_05175 [Elusimicrobia bacterium]|nr:hypothetical protein [Elusimicrobiota bacterium]
MIWIEIKTSAQNPYMASNRTAVYDGLINACADALGIKKEDVIITSGITEGGPDALLIISVTLPQQYGATEKQQLSMFILKNLAAGAQVKLRDAALIINEVPKQNMSGLWSVK